MTHVTLRNVAKPDTHSEIVSQAKDGYGRLYCLAATGSATAGEVRCLACQPWVTKTGIDHYIRYFVANRAKPGRANQGESGARVLPQTRAMFPNRAKYLTRAFLDEPTPPAI